MLPKPSLLLLAFTALSQATPIDQRDTCNHDNVLRCLIGAPATATPYCSSFLSIGTKILYTATTTPTSTVTALATITVTSGPVKRAAAPAIAYTIYGPNPITVVGPSTTAVLLGRRDLAPRVTTPVAADTSPAPGCLAQYSAPASRLTSACNCISIASPTVSTVSTAPATTTTTTITSIDTITLTPTPTPTPTPLPPTCQNNCAICSSDADCCPGFQCDAYYNFPGIPDSTQLCTPNDVANGNFNDICSAISPS